MTSQIPYIDLHQDIAANSFYISNKDPLKKHGLHEGSNNSNWPVNNQVDLPRLQKSGARCVFAASFSAEVVPAGADREAHSLEVFRQINFYHDLTKAAKRKWQIIRDSREYKTAKDEGKIGLLLHLEGAEALDEKGIYLKALYELGLRSLGLTHNKKNQFAGGAKSNGGLTKKGREILEKASELGMIKDIAHLNKRSMNQVLEFIQPPFMYSHGGLKADKDSPRSIDDEQAVKIAEKGGIIGVGFLPNVLSENDKETVGDIFKHLKDLVGVDALAIGSDFDGILSPELVKGLEEVSKMPNLASVLEEKGFTKNQIEKIFYKNAEERLLKHLKQ